ncbi:CPBP family intramembrane glutamic endopeptidase [Pediococcus argentinicus]|uniref:CPBP family intramembrane glutamic endopeptidase n=1 Tax=Pediococcus argentinicus TaxID=480391 RepID=UPI00338E8658
MVEKIIRNIRDRDYLKIFTFIFGILVFGTIYPLLLGKVMFVERNQELNFLIFFFFYIFVPVGYYYFWKMIGVKQNSIKVTILLGFILLVVIVAYWFGPGDYQSSFLNGGYDFFSNRNTPMVHSGTILITQIWLRYIGPCFFGPITEELLFRFWLVSLKSMPAKLFGVVLSCVLFTLYHMNFAPKAMATFFIFGLFQACTYLIFKNIKYNIVFHIIFNIL